MINRNLFGIFLILLLFLMVVPIEAQPNNTNEMDTHEKNLATISMFTASGDLEQLAETLNEGLDAGLTINEIKEALVQLYAYCGFPRSLNAINTFQQVLDERESNGINDPEGKPIRQNSAANKYEQGRKVLEEITQTPQKKPAPGFGEFAPRIDVFLKEHLFADIFASEVLTYKQREVVTISALAVMTGVEPQLKAHVEFGKNTGVSNTELEEIATLIAKNFNNERANVLLKIMGMEEKPLVDPGMMVRIAEIEVYPQYLDEYLAFAKEVAVASIKNEPGVVSVFPMQTKENPNLIRIIEIYSSKEVYDAHIASNHFQKYKTSTPHMIKDLKLVDMNMLAPENLNEIFKRTK